MTVTPRRGSQDKEPCNNLDLTAITGQTVESAHLFDVHLGETLVPYATLEPLKALLPLRRGESSIPVDTNGVGGVRLGGLDRRMRERWRTINDSWEHNKAAANELDLLGRVDYHRELSSQFEWQRRTKAKGRFRSVTPSRVSRRPHCFKTMPLLLTIFCSGLPARTNWKLTTFLQSSTVAPFINWRPRLCPKVIWFSRPAQAPVEAAHPRI